MIPHATASANILRHVETGTPTTVVAALRAAYEAIVAPDRVTVLAAPVAEHTYLWTHGRYNALVAQMRAALTEAEKELQP